MLCTLCGQYIKMLCAPKPSTFYVFGVGTYKDHGLGQRSRYSDLLWAGQSGDRIPMGARFSTPIQTAPGAYPASYTMGIGSFLGGNVAREWRLATHPHPVPRLKKEQCYTSTPPMGLCGLIQGELYLYLTYTKITINFFFSIYGTGT